MTLYLPDTVGPTGAFPIFQDTDGYGGFQVRSSTTDRDSIPAFNRKQGMLVYCIADGQFYQLNADLTSWTAVVFSSINANSPTKLNNYLSVDTGTSTVDYYFANDSNTFVRFVPDQSANATLPWSLVQATGSYTLTNTSVILRRLGSEGAVTNVYGGLRGRSWYFNGTDGYISRQSSNPLPGFVYPIPPGGNSITVSAWVKTDLATGPASCLIFQKYNDSLPSNPSFRIIKSSQDGSWRIDLTIVSGGINTSCTLSIDKPQFKIKNNEWTLLSFTYDGYYVSAYTNGQLAAQYGITGYIYTDTDQTKGSYDIGGKSGIGFFSGYIDDLRVDSTVRNQAYLFDTYTKIINKFHTSENAHIGGSLFVDGPTVSRISTKQDCLLPTDGYTFINWNFDATEGTSSFTNSGTESSVSPLTKVNEGYSYGAGVNGASLYLGTAIYGHTSTLLMDGSVLIAGGYTGASSTSSAAIYNTYASTILTTSLNMTVPRQNHTATLLKSGKVLIAGGYNSNSATNSEMASAELYDPSTQTFYPIATMNSARSKHTATLLNDGRVLIVGGWLLGSPLNTAELYDPVDGSFKSLSTIGNYYINGHTATLLNSGDVLIAGGYGNTSLLTSSQGYAVVCSVSVNGSDATLTVTPTSNQMKTARHYHTATLLDDGTVLFVGGTNYYAPTSSISVLNTTEIYDPTTKYFSTTSTPTLNSARYLHSATKLKNGDVLIIGGYNTSNAATKTVENFNYQSKTFSNISNIDVATASHAASSLYDGRVLIS